MYTMYITLNSGTVYPIDYYSYQVAVDSARDHMRAPDVREAVVVNKATGELLWYPSNGRGE